MTELRIQVLSLWFCLIVSTIWWSLHIRSLNSKIDRLEEAQPKVVEMRK